LLAVRAATRTRIDEHRHGVAPQWIAHDPGLVSWKQASLTAAELADSERGAQHEAASVAARAQHARDVGIAVAMAAAVIASPPPSPPTPNPSNGV
jgi:hypothetical protein